MVQGDGHRVRLPLFGVYLATYMPAFDFMIINEDSSRSWAESVDNNGGGVIAGINEKTFPSQFAYIRSIFQPNRGTAIAEFYQAQFWTPMLLGGVENQDIANRVLDAAVNMGPKTAVKMLQSAFNLLPLGGLAVDGAIGPNTLAAVNGASSDALLAAFRQVRADRYRVIVANNPFNEPYLNGWLKRAEA